MASQPVPHRPTELGSPYCSDPNCIYCKNLREAQEQLKKSNAEYDKSRGAGKTG
jgi:hypothetical protein